MIEIANNSEKSETSDKSVIHDKLKKTILYFYGLYVLSYVFAVIFRFILPIISVPFQITEIDKEVRYTMDSGEFTDILFLGILFSLACLYIFNWLLEIVPHRENIKKEYSILFILGILLLNYGIMTHMVTNSLNEIIKKMTEAGEIIPAGSELEQLSLGIYFWDEIISHILLTTGFFMLSMLFIRMEQHNEIKKNICTKKDHKLFGLTFIIGGFVAFMSIEGQVSVIFLVLCFIILSYILISYHKKNYHAKPFTLASVWFLLGYILFTIIWALIFGVKENFPYLYQFTEVI